MLLVELLYPGCELTGFKLETDTPASSDDLYSASDEEQDSFGKAKTS